MRRLSRFCNVCLCAAAFAGCAKSEPRGAHDTAMADTSAGAAAAPASRDTVANPSTAGTLSLAQLTGKWNMRSVPESGPDTTATTYVLTATANRSGWTMRFPNNESVPVRVGTVAGDSIVVDAGPFASRRRRGMQVRTQSVFRLQGDRLVGSTVAHYRTSRPDSVLRLRSEGTRAP